MSQFEIDVRAWTHDRHLGELSRRCIPEPGGSPPRAVSTLGHYTPGSPHRVVKGGAPDVPDSASDTQLRNIEAATGMSIAAFAAAVSERGIDGHAKILAFLKAEYGLTYGNANAVALKVRELAAGGPAPSDALLDAQYAGVKAAMRPVYERLAHIAAGLGPDVVVIVQKTAVAFRRRRNFAVVQVASAKRVQLGLNLDAAPGDPRVAPTPGAMCAFRVDLSDVKSIDAAVTQWLREAYEQAG